MGLTKRQNLNPLDVLAALLAVDGHGSGLDADMVDGLHGSDLVTVAGDQGIFGMKAFAVSPQVPDPTGDLDAANKEYVDSQVIAGITPEEILAKLITVDGPGSGLDADTVDGLHGHDLVQIAGAQTITGAKTFSVPPTIPSPTAATDAANKDYVDAKVAAGGGGTGTTDHSVLTNRDMAGQHPTAAITGLDTALAALAPLASPALTGTPTAPTAAAGTNTTQLATTAFVTAATAGASGSFVVGTYTGTGTDQQINLGFRPSRVIIRYRGARDATGDKLFFVGVLGNEAFTTGFFASGYYNVNAATFDYMAWR